MDNIVLFVCVFFYTNIFIILFGNFCVLANKLNIMSTIIIIIPYFTHSSSKMLSATFMLPTMYLLAQACDICIKIDYIHNNMGQSA